MMRAAATVLALASAMSGVYLGVLGLLGWRAPKRSAAARRSRHLCLIVPAHNEAPRIGALIDSVRAQRYDGQIDTIVVADNCTDATALIAASRGATVVERKDGAHRGKGYALSEGLRRLPADAEAVLFVDGDCTLGAGAIAAFNAALDGGARAVQARYLMQAGEHSASADARALALSLVHVVRPLARMRLGGSAGLKGSGMCFDRSLIDEVGWRAHGLAEDIEQHLTLLRAGERVHYAHDAVVTGEAPSRLEDAVGQHERWEAGRARSAIAEGPALLAEGIRRRSPTLVDAAVELMLPPLSMLGALAAIAGLAAIVAGGARTRWLAATGWAGTALYVAAGTRHAAQGARTIATLAVLPLYAVWKVARYARALIRPPAGWEPTRRG